jgi:mannose-6-phosphate isomerase-like protein (cupin superfamily)
VDLSTTSNKFSENGITINHQEMPNGELRFRMMDENGNGYIRTVTTVGGWQNSHSHNELCETYVVEQGWMGFAKLLDGKLTLNVLSKGETVTTPIGMCHNVYLPSGAIIHTVKHGGASGITDWTPCQKLDELSKGLHEHEILAQIA